MRRARTKAIPLAIPEDTALQYGPGLIITAPSAGFVAATMSLSIGSEGRPIDCAALQRDTI